MLLPAKARIAQYEADKLTVSGKSEEAKAKLKEMREAERAPETMHARQREIVSRIETIEEEKKAEARRIFQEWYADVQHVIRAAEHGLFIVLLDQLESSFYSYQESTGTGTSDNRQRPLLHQGLIAGLTAPERSIEWRSGQRRYGGRG